MKHEVLLLTGPIRSGKTTALMNWCRNRNDVSGLLAPDQSGQRFLYDVALKQYIPFQSPEPSDNSISIGRFHFYKEGFQAAQRIIREALTASPEYILLDEIGPLELKGQGYEPACSELIEMLQHTACTTKLILVVRENLVNEVCEKFRLTEARHITKNYFADGC